MAAAEPRPRIPPNQHVVSRVLQRDLGVQPPFDPASWDLRVEGMVERRLRLSWDELLAFPSHKQVSDFHCVEGWSVLDCRWEGVLVRTLAEAAGLQPAATHLFVRCADGYSTGLPLEAALAPDTLIAYRFSGEPIPTEGGGPVRLVVPPLYAYKSAKYARVLLFDDRPRLGHWESKGYSDSADPWRDDRYSR